MRAEDLILEVRDVNLARVGQITTDRLVVTADLVDPVNATGPGTWSVSLPREDDLTDPLLEPGAGVICTHAPTGKVLWSGPTRLRAVDRSTKDTLGMVTIQGVTDEALVWRRRAYPTPTAASTAQVDGYDVRTGPAETVMRGYVLANLGPTAHVDRRVPLLTVAPDQARGASVKASARFDPLGDLLASLGRVSGLSWRVVQVGDHLEFQVFYPADLSDVIRLSLESGTLATQRTEDGPPTVTRVIVMGQGEAADRQIVERTTPAAEAAETAWGPWARSEVTLDQRQTDDPVELAQAGDKALADAAGGASVRLIPSDDLAMPWPETWNVGDLITVETGAEPVVVPVTAVALRVGPQGVKVGATIGNPPATGPIDAVKATQAVTEKRVEALERTAEAGAQAVQEIPVQAASAPPSSYPEGLSVFTTTTEADWPATMLLVETLRHSGGRTIQRATRRTHGTVWFRATDPTETGWTPWQVLDWDALYQPAQEVHGLFSGTTDASGYLTIAHGLGTTPLSIAASIASHSSSSNPVGGPDIPHYAITDTITSTHFRIRVIGNRNGAAPATYSSMPVRGQWVALLRLPEFITP